MGLEDVREQLRQAKAECSKLTAEKDKNNSERIKIESMVKEFTQLKKKINAGITDFEGNVSKRAANVEGNFGQYYQKKIKDSMNKGGIYNLDLDASDAINALKNKIFDLDSVIASLKAKISEKNSLINSLKNMLNDLVD